MTAEIALTAVRRRRFKPTADLLRRAARRADIARKLRRRDVSSLLMGIGLGAAGLLMPHALDRHAPRAAQAAVAGSSTSDLAPATALPVMVATPENSAAVEARALPRAPDGLFYATVRVNGQPVRFLVDTGASVMTLTASDARRLGVTPDERHYRASAQTANGNAVFAWTSLQSVEMAGRRLQGVRAAVLASDSGVSLLGQNVLAKLGTVRLENDQLVIS